MDILKNTNELFENKKYQHYLKEIQSYEYERLFCCHNMEHFLTVARITTIKCLEKKEEVSRDLIYTTALLHDIGRFREYQKQIPHEIASFELANSLLKELDFSEAENNIILDAILNHRNPKSSGFSHIFYESDKLSRNCYFCPVKSQCNWSDEKKNLKISY